MKFNDLIKRAVVANDSLVCIGLDPDSKSAPTHDSNIVEFNKAIIDATKDLVCAYKPNSAFYEALMPFLAREDKGIIVLCRTSNPGAGKFQDLQVGDKKVYQIVAERVKNDWDQNGNCALVVGATYPGELGEVRQLVGESMLILVPGIGAQGGDIGKTVRAGINRNGEGIIVNSARGIIYASKGKYFAEAARLATTELRNKINVFRK